MVHNKQKSFFQVTGRRHWFLFSLYILAAPYTNAIILNNNQPRLNPQSEPYHRLVERDDEDSLTLSTSLVMQQMEKGEVIELYKKKINEARVFGDLHKLARLNLELGEIFYNWGQYSVALKYFLEANTISLQNRYTDTESKALNLIGKYYHTTGNFDEALEYYEKALKIALKNNDTIQIVGLYNNIGNHFSDHGEIAKGLHYCLRAYNLQKDNPVHFESFSSTCNHLGNIYNELNDYPKALFFHHKALAARRSIGYTEGVGKSYLNLAKVYYDLKQIDSSAFYSSRALLIFRQVGYAKGTIKCLMHNGLLNQHFGRMEQAKAFLFQADSLSAEVGYIRGTLQSQLSLAGIFQSEGSFSTSIDYYHSCLHKALEHNNKPIIRDCYRGLQVSYENLHQYKLANEAGRKYIELSEYLLEEAYQQQIASVKVTLETENQQKQNELLRAENQLKTLQIKQKNLVILLFVLCFLLMTVLALVSLSRYTKKRAANKMLTDLNEELKSVNREKDKFFSIIAHELRNPLWWVKNITETLSGRFEQMSRAELAESLRSLDESAKNTFLLMDNLLNWTRSKMELIPYHPQVVHINELVEQNVQLFQSFIRQKNIQLRISLCSEGFVYIDINLMNTVLRNVLSNALKFTPQNGSIKVSSEAKENQLILLIEDSGVGVDSKIIDNLFDDKRIYSTLGLMQEKGSGIGLKLCKDFIEKNHGLINISSKLNEGTRIRLELPLAATEFAAGGAINHLVAEML